MKESPSVGISIFLGTTAHPINFRLGGFIACRL